MERDGEKLCNKCGEWWPADLEFFYSEPKAAGGLYYACKACYREVLAPDYRKQFVASQQPRATDAIAPLLTQLFVGGPL